MTKMPELTHFDSKGNAVMVDVSNKPDSSRVASASASVLMQPATMQLIIDKGVKKGDVISWSSAGKMGFRGSKKNTPYAAQLAAEDAVVTAKEAGLRKVKVYVKGPGNGRESAIRSIHNGGIEVTEIIDVTPTPHNGCRPPKRRRV